MFDLVEVEEGLRKTAGADVVLAGDDELVSAVGALAGLRALLDATEAHVLTELHARGMSERDLGLTTATLGPIVGDEQPAGA